MWFVQNCVPSVAEHVHEILEEKNSRKSHYIHMSSYLWRVIMFYNIRNYNNHILCKSRLMNTFRLSSRPRAITSTDKSISFS